MAEEQRQEGTAEWQNDLRQEEGLSDCALFVVTRDDIQQARLVERYMSRVPLIGRDRSTVLADRMRSGGIAAQSTGKRYGPPGVGPYRLKARTCQDGRNYRPIQDSILWGYLRVSHQFPGFFSAAIFVRPYSGRFEAGGKR